jgi:PDZ domain-containing protein
MLCLVLAVLSGVLRVPYVVLTPGPTVNTLGADRGTAVITIEGHSTEPTTGNLNLTTVSADTQKTTVFRALTGWLSRKQVVVPYDSVYPPNKTREQQNESDKQDFVQSQDNAVAAAACELEYPKGIGVASIPADSPNKDVIKVHDQFISLNGTPTPDDKSLRAVLTSLKVGDKVPAVVRRAGVNTNVTLTLGTPNEGSTSPRIGIQLIEGCLLPFDIKVDLTGIGGPSAGLMFTLGILDKLGPDDLTHGKFIAGTGTITPDGEVGPIGGIQLKMLGAKRDGATVFLAPADNCGDVRGNIPKGLDVVKVSTLHDAVQALDDLAVGKPVPHC